MDPFAEWFFVREMLARQRLVDNDHSGRAHFIAHSESASLHQRYSSRAKIVRCAKIKIRVVANGRLTCSADYRKRRVLPPTGHRHRSRHSGCLDAVKIFNSLQRALEEGRA